MEIKKTVKWDGKLKNLHFEGDTLLTEDGETIDLIKYLKAVCEQIRSFDFSITTKEEELVEVNIYDVDDEE